MSRMDEQLKNAERRYEELLMMISDPQVLADHDRYLAYVQEYHQLEELVVLQRRIREINAQIEMNKVLLTESEEQDFRDLIREENLELESEGEEKRRALQIALIPKDPNDSKNVIVEIRAGAGGEEAALFVADLLRMYEGYAATNGWKVELIDASETGLGGYREVIFMLRGQGVYSQMRYESGVHRVQRVPETESGGRIHTSTVTVAVLPEAEDVDIEINPADLQVDTYRASGAGGQHVNKTSSAIRITHLPSGMVVTCQDQRSQHENRDRAMTVLRARLLEIKQSSQEQQIASDRREQVGTGDRSERIRTYNYPQGRVSDHRIGLTLYQLDQVLAGAIEPFVNALQAQAYEARIASGEQD